MTTLSGRDIERIKKELFGALTYDLERVSSEMSQESHDYVVASVEKRMAGVVERLERGVAAGLAQIASDLKARVESLITERFALLAGEARLKLRKLEAKAQKAEETRITRTPKLKFDPAMTMPQPPYSGEELANVQSECKEMLEKLNQQIL